MEITRRFIKFLEELEDSQVQEKYLTPELEENLKTITQMISKLNLNAPRKLRSLNDLQIFEKTLVEGCSHIPQKLKKTIEAISVLHVFATNHPLTQDNVPQFLEEYCRNLFECHSISLLSSDTKMKNLPSTIDGVKSIELEAALKIVEELDDLMKEKMFHTLDASSLGGLEPYLAEKNYIGNIVLKLNEGQTRYYLIMHFKTDSPFTGSYITGKYYQDFPYSFNILIESVRIANHLMDKKTLIIFLGKLESLKLELIELHKRYFLSFIATELTTSLECEVYPTIVLGHQEDVINDLTKSDNKLIQMVLVEGRSLELLNNFDWDNTNLNQKLFILWEKLHKYLKIKEQGIFYHFYMERTFDVFLEFTKDNKLIYQSKPFENQDHRSLVDIRDFLKDPNARSVDVIMSKFKPALEMVHKYLDETRESKMLIFRKEGIWRNVHFEFIGKRKESKKVVEAFGIVLKEEKKPTKIVTFDSLIDNLTTINKSTPQHNMTLKAVRKLLSTRNVNPKNVLGENADINDLKKTIVSEYLPEELTSTNDETHKSISSVNRIKLDMITNTAFSDSPMLKKENSARVRVVGSPTSGLLKQEPFSPQNLISRKNDMEIFDNWSFDAIRIDDNDEKSRIVWAMLNESGLIREFKIQKNILCEFINRIQEGYNENKNPFHNYEHGITVMHGAFYILRHISTKFTNLVNLGTLISAFCHDVGHTGRNNIFEVNSMTKLAIRYHDKSVLEQHHAAITFKILNKETSNIFCNVKPEDFKQLRKLIISNILATDMKVHFDVTTAFEDLHGRIQASGEDDFAWNDDDVTTVTNMVLHCSDLCGPSKKFDVAHHWAQRINKEFSTQVREEEALGIPVTPYFKNLDKPEIMAKQEIAFISFMIKPLWVNFNKFVSGGMQIAVDNIEINLKEWNLKLEKALKQKEEETSPK